MAQIQHKNITEADLHETKGASTASANSVHIANGAGSTSWSKISTDNIDTGSIFNTNKVVLTISVPSPNAVFTRYVPLPANMLLSSCYAVLDAAATGATLNIVVANTTLTCSTFSFATSDVAGTVKSDITPANNVFTAGSTIIIKNTTSVTSAGNLTVTLVFTQTGL